MVQVGILVGLEAYRDLVRTDGLKGTVSIALILPLALKFGIAGIVTGYIISSFFGVLTNQYFIRKNLKLLNTTVHFRFSLPIIRKILNIGLPVFIATLVISFATWLTNKMVFAQLNGAAALGIVFVCRQIMTLIQFFPVQISRVLLPIISEDSDISTKKVERKTSLAAVVSICTILALLGLAFGKVILAAYNLDPVTATAPYRIILIAVIFSSVNMILGQFVIAGRNPWVRTYADIAIALVMIGITYFLKDNNVYSALPYALLISYIVSDFIIIAYLRGKPVSFKSLYINRT
jgi:O-antigen/teichoic acid export membrane protein